MAAMMLSGIVLESLKLFLTAECLMIIKLITKGILGHLSFITSLSYNMS